MEVSDGKIIKSKFDNILEEIVWYKQTEVAQLREKSVS